ncbi:MAG: type IV pilin protein [Methylococcaceae bacterium]|nr:type IV pilin protein [Methylococcaceae bacterium]
MVNHRKQAGFSFLELVGVLAVIGILAAVAFPSYQQSIRKGRRSDGWTALAQEASMQEVFAISAGGNYSPNLLGKWTKSAKGDYVSANGYYILAITTNPAVCVTTPCFRVTATASGDQAKDKSCPALTLDNRGNKTAGC